MKNFEIKIEFTPRQFADMLVSAIECNFMTQEWCEGVFWQNEKAPPPSGHSPWYDNDKLFGGEFKLQVIENYDKRVKHFITHKDVEEGLAVMAKDYSRHFADMLNEEGDNITSDVFLQCCVFKDVIYG